MAPTIDGVAAMEIVTVAKSAAADMKRLRLPIGDSFK